MICVFHSQFAVVVNGILRRRVHSVVNFHYRCLVPASVAIVGRTKHCHYRPIVLPLIPLHDQLMSSRDKVEVVNVSELLRNVLPKRITGASRRDAPATATRAMEKSDESGSVHEGDRKGSEIMTLRTDHPDPTIPSRTWALHGEPLVRDQVPKRDPVYRWTVIVLHGDKKCDPPRRPSWVSNRTYR